MHIESYPPVINIKMEAFAAKVLRKHCDAAEDEVIYIYDNTLPGKAWQNVLFDPPLPTPPKTMRTVSLKLSERLYKAFDAKHLEQLSVFYVKVAQRVIFDFIDCAVALGKTQKDGFDAFRKLYDVSEDEFPEENALQMYKLHRVTPTRHKRW